MISHSLNKDGLQPASKLLYILPSAVSVVRVILALAIVEKVGDWTAGMPVVAFLGVLIVIVLDAVDGIIARYFNSQTLLGSFIAADRLVEFIFLQYFVRAGLVPLWFVLIFYTRILLTDGCRIRAFSMDRVSATGIFLPGWRRIFVLSKFSRSTYAVFKGLLFCTLFLAMHNGKTLPSLPEFSIMLGVLAFSLLRAIPILITYLPHSRNLDSDRQLNDKWPLTQDIAIRTTRVTSYMQIAADFCLAAILVMLTGR